MVQLAVFATCTIKVPPDVIRTVCTSFKNCSSKKKGGGDFPGGPVIKTLCFHGRGHEFDPWTGN